MTREWKPGDVAHIGGVYGPALRTLGGRWVTMRADNGSRALCDDSDVARPLVVIDPEDRDQVERLYASWLDNLAAPEREAQVNAMQAALRSLFDPPKPDEPTGLGAVVECEHQGQPGVAVRHGSGWTFTADHVTDHSVDWGDFDAVRVLSEGVEVDR